MQKIVVWGTGNLAATFIEYKVYHKNFEVICFTDNDQKKWGETFGGKRIISPDSLKDIEFDAVLICTRKTEEIEKQLVCDLKVEKKYILRFKDIENKLIARISDKYKDSDDEEIQSVLECFNRDGLNVYGSYRIQGKKRRHHQYV